MKCSWFNGEDKCEILLSGYYSVTIHFAIIATHLCNRAAVIFYIIISKKSWLAALFVTASISTTDPFDVSKQLLHSEVHLQRAPLFQANIPAASFAKYVAIKSAPALFIAVRLSRIAFCSSSHPICAAAFIMAYSPLT